MRLTFNQSNMSENNRNDKVLHWVSMKTVLETLVEEYWFEGLDERIKVNCFRTNPTIASSLKFLRKTEWARLQVQGLYVRTVLEKKNHEK